MSARDINKELYQQLYKEWSLVDQSDRFKCYYCGEPASTKDHQPPISVIDRFITSDFGFECVMVPCCTHCNSMLGAYASTTLADRFYELKNRLRDKYKKFFRLAGVWEIEELMELGDSLRSMILASIDIGIEAEKRLFYQGHKINHSVETWCTAGFNECDKCGVFYKGNGCPECEV